MSMSKVDIHQMVCGMLNDTYKNKNADYGDSFEKVFEKAGIVSCYTRIADKFLRFENLALNGNETKVSSETMQDTLLDLANYCIMTTMLMNGE